MSAFCRIVLAPVAIFAAPVSAALAQKNIAGSADHALVGRYESSVATFYQDVSGHAVERKRLMPTGDGMAAPVATNRTEDGRAKNRRVEIVERIVGC